MLIVKFKYFTNTISKVTVMAFKTSWIENDKLVIVQLRFQPKPVWISHEKMSVLVEIRETQTREVKEVWHLHMTLDDAKITHKDRKYP